MAPNSRTPTTHISRFEPSFPGTIYETFTTPIFLWYLGNTPSILVRYFGNTRALRRRISSKWTTLRGEFATMEGAPSHCQPSLTITTPRDTPSSHLSQIEYNFHHKLLQELRLPRRCTLTCPFVERKLCLTAQLIISQCRFTSLTERIPSAVLAKVIVDYTGSGILFLSLGVEYNFSGFTRQS